MAAGSKVTMSTQTFKQPQDNRVKDNEMRRIRGDDRGIVTVLATSIFETRNFENAKAIMRGREN